MTRYPAARADPAQVQIRRGPNIKPLPTRGPLEDPIAGEVLIKLGDNISTDTILPAGAQVLPLRSNIPAIAEFVFHYPDPTFVGRAKAKGAGSLSLVRTMVRAAPVNMRRCVRCISASRPS